MFGMKKCSCGEGGRGDGLCGCRGQAAERTELTLAELPIGATATIVTVMPKMRGRKKFADIGLVAGSELRMEAHAPFGGLLRVKVMATSMALHRDDAVNIVMRKAGE